MDYENDITYIARTAFRNDARVFGIRRKDRRHHMYVLGKTGTGKSTLLSVLAEQDVRRGEGLALLDPHGDLAERLLATMPAHRRSDLVYFNVPAHDQDIHFNPLDSVPLIKRPLVGAWLLDAFKKIWADSWGVRMEHILRNTLLTLLDQPEATLADMLPLLDNRAFRTRAVDRTTNHQVRRFWLHEYENYSWRYRSDAIAPIQNKVGAFLANPILNRILGHPRSSFNLREIMDQGKILLVNLAKGKLGEDPSSLLGALLVSQIGSAGLARADIAEEERRDFYLYLDEFQTFTTLSLSGMLSELRKYRVNMILANQYIAQVQEEVMDAIMGNVGTIISFRVGPRDAAFLAKEFYPVFDLNDLINLPNHAIYLKIMVDGTVSQPFSANTILSSDIPKTFSRISGIGGVFNC